MRVTLVAGEEMIVYPAITITKRLLKELVPLASGGLVEKSEHAAVIPDDADILHLQDGHEYIVKLNPGT
jgi:hypothetical protein